MFAGKADHDADAAKEQERERYEEVGRLKMQLKCLKTKLASSWGLPGRATTTVLSRKQTGTSSSCG